MLDGLIAAGAGQSLDVSVTNNANLTTINGLVAVGQGASLSFDDLSGAGYSDPMSLR